MSPACNRVLSVMSLSLYIRWSLKIIASDPGMSSIVIDAEFARAFEKRITAVLLSCQNQAMTHVTASP
jgi:hypothetical protein